MKDYLRIVFVVKGFPTLSQTFIINQLVSLIKAGHKVTIYARYKGEMKNLHPALVQYDLMSKVIFEEQVPSGRKLRLSLFLSWIKDNFFQIRWIDLFKSLDKEILNKSNFLKTFFKNKWFLSGKRFDVIHVHFGVNGLDIAKLKKNGFFRRSNLIVSFHGFDLAPNKIESYREKYEEIFQQASSLTVNTPYTEDLLKKAKPDSKKIRILPVGLDTSFYKKCCRAKNSSPVIVFCGRLIPLKGPDIAIDILQELIERGHEEVCLEMVGEGDFRKVLEEKIQFLNLDNRVILRGALPPSGVKKVLGKASVLIMPGTVDPVTSRVETQGLVIQEAQSMEVPVVVSDVGGMKYGLIQGETGFVIKDGDIRGFADAIEKILKNSELKRKFGKRGREFVKENYDSDILVRKLLNIYQAK